MREWTDTHAMKDEEGLERIKDSTFSLTKLELKPADIFPPPVTPWFVLKHRRFESKLLLIRDITGTQVIQVGCRCKHTKCEPRGRRDK